LNANDYVELIWSADSTQVSLGYSAASSSDSNPSTPSAIFTAEQLASSGVQGAQGSPGAQGPQGSQGTNGAAVQVYTITNPSDRYSLSSSVVKNGDLVNCPGNPQTFTVTFTSGIIVTSGPIDIEILWTDDVSSDPTTGWSIPSTLSTASQVATSFASWINTNLDHGGFTISTVGATVTVGFYSYQDIYRQLLNNISTFVFGIDSGSGSLFGYSVSPVSSGTAFQGNWVVIDNTKLHNDEGYLFTPTLPDAPNDGNLYARKNNSWQSFSVSNPFNQSLNTTNSVSFNNIATNNGAYSCNYDDGFGSVDYWDFGSNNGSDFVFYSQALGDLVLSLNSSGVVVLNPLSSAPAGVPGGLYYNSSTHHFYGYNGTTWKQLDN
jgi:hypothetical protein